MPETLLGLTESQVMRLRRLLDTVEGSGEPPVSQRGRPRPQASRIVIGVLSDQAPATTGFIETPNVSSLNIYTFSSTGYVDTGLDETCYNFAPQAATTDRWTVCERCSMTGKLIITTQFCS